MYPKITAIGRNKGPIYGISLDEESEKNAKIKEKPTSEGKRQSRAPRKESFLSGFLKPADMASTRNAHQGSVPAIMMGT